MTVRFLTAGALAAGLLMMAPGAATAVPMGSAVTAGPTANPEVPVPGITLVRGHGGPGGFGGIRGGGGGGFRFQGGPHFGGHFGHFGHGHGHWHGHGHGVRFYPYYYGYAPYYYGDYDYYYGDDYVSDDCLWLRRKAVRTNSRYWWRRYHACRDSY
jgi:hypothetical protein